MPAKLSPLNICLFNMGFRIFFLGAGIFSILAIIIWMANSLFQIPLPVNIISSSQWHAHELIYGYSIAVITGFLLTAVKNWTGLKALTGMPLAALFILWALARILFLFGSSYLIAAAITELLFSMLLIFFIGYPLIKVKQWRQMAILSKLILLAVFNLLFYLGALNLLESGIFWGIYGGLYLVIGLVMTMARRVLPFFIERGVGYPIVLFNSRWLDISSLLLFLAFFVSELFVKNQAYSAYFTLGLFAVNSIRLTAWHTHGIWNKSLLWSLYLSFWFINFGFLLFAGVHFFNISKFLAIHAFAFGGVGVVTMAMMTRVSLGHTGRDIRKPPAVMSYAFIVLLSGALIRVVTPIFDPDHYMIWIGLSEIFWIIAYLIFVIVLTPMLIKPRVDGRAG